MRPKTIESPLKMQNPRPSKPPKKSVQASNQSHIFATELTSAQKKRLRALAHGLKPVVQIGSEGVSAGIVQAVQSALNTHELVKVQLQGQSSSIEKNDETRALLQPLGSRVHLAGRIGRMLILYFEKHPAEAQLPLKVKPVRLASSRPQGTQGRALNVP